MINIHAIISHNVETMELLLSLESPFTSKHPELTFGELQKFANSGIITKLGSNAKSIVQYNISDHQRKIINEVLTKL